ncbi:terminase large subunit [Bacillus phage vB_BpsS-140]|nr:terminase large subunit [Bacillus phage vB_BpsS-140]
MNAIEEKKTNDVEVVDLLTLINPHFYSLWLTEKSHIIAKGGRSSTKSSVIALRMVKRFLDDPNGNCVVLRKVAKYLSTSVYENIQWAILKLGVENQFLFGKSPLRITHRETGTAFYFFGVDDPIKLKSAKIAKGYVMSLFFEETAEFDGVTDIDTVEDTFIREDLGDKEVEVYFAYNPPRNPYNWVNLWVASKANDEDYFIHHSDYEDDELGFLSKQMIRKIENYKKFDHDYWRWMYKGEIIGLGDTIYNINSFRELADDIPTDDYLMYIDITSDTGHQVSATTHLAIGVTAKQKVVLLDTYYYNPHNREVKKAPSELSTDYKKFIDRVRKRWKRPIHSYFIDSAEGALRNQIYKDHHIRTQPVAKSDKETMIEYTQDLLADGKVHYLNIPNNQIFIEEHKKYQWKEGTTNTPNPVVVKEDDHTCDAFQYWVMMKRVDLGLSA